MKTHRDLFRVGWLLAAVCSPTLLVGHASRATADDAKPAAAAYGIAQQPADDANPAAAGQEDDDELNALLRAMLQRSDDRKARYNVPQGDVAALVKSIERMAQYRPVEPEDLVEYQRRFRPALEEAAQRIVKLEKDHDSEAYQAARFILLQNRVYWLAQIGPAEQRRAVEDVNEYLKEQLKRGNTRMATSLAETAACTLQRIGQWDEAIAFYESYASQYTKNSDSEVAGWGDSMRGEAERLRAMNANAPKPAAVEIAPRGKMFSVDLSRAANWGISDWPRGSFEGNGLAELGKGEQSLAGVTFAIGEKMLQLGGPFNAPAKIEGVSVGRKLRRLYLLQAVQGASTGAVRPDGVTLATYKIHYADGTQESLPVELGKDVRNWFDFDQGKPVSRGRVVWTGSNTRSSRRGVTLRLYLGVWNNPHPEKPVATIDFIKADEPLYAPFCLAMTAEE
jgi:tetratricopeptide (TPR) repeat protein